MKRVMTLDAELTVNDYTLAAKLDKDLISLASEVSLGTEGGGTSDYRKLKNKPTINGTELYDNYDEIDPTVPDWAKEATKPTYTAEELGLDHEEIKYHEIDNWFKAVFNLD